MKGSMISLILLYNHYNNRLIITACNQIRCRTDNMHITRERINRKVKYLNLWDRNEEMDRICKITKSEKITVLFNPAICLLIYHRFRVVKKIYFYLILPLIPLEFDRPVLNIDTWESISFCSKNMSLCFTVVLKILWKSGVP